MSDDKAVNLLWTGGWDSTFRLLQLVWGKGEPVQPYYLIDPQRPSLAHEIKAMYGIQAAVAAARPEAGELIRSIHFRALDDLPPNRTISEQYRRMSVLAEPGIQYEWLARMAAAEGLTNLEIGFQAHAGQMSFWQARIRRGCAPIQDERGDDNYQMAANPDPPELAMFGRFRFPIVQCTKMDIHAWAVAHGCDKIMNLTWFCHRPRGQATPCGLCNPCKIAFKENRVNKFPLTSKMRYYVGRIYKRWRA